MNTSRAFIANIISHVGSHPARHFAYIQKLCQSLFNAQNILSVPSFTVKEGKRAIDR
jgi:hypothetical protein